MRYEELTAFIEENSEDDDFTGGVSGEEIEQIEQTLNVVFPQSYKWFLQNYGSGGLFGVDILGCGRSTPSVVSKTEKLRSLGMPYKYVVIEDCEEFFYCLDTNDISNEECSIISWDRVSELNGKRAENFADFLFNRLCEAKDNWEE